RARTLPGPVRVGFRRRNDLPDLPRHDAPHRRGGPHPRARPHRPPPMTRLAAFPYEKRKDNHMSPLKQAVPVSRAEGRPGHTRSGGEPAMEPSTTETPAQGPSLRSARVPATVADITRPSAATVGEYDHVAAAAYLMKHAGSAALVVLGIEHGNRPVGMITEADVAGAVADGTDVNETRVHDLLAARPPAIPPATGIPHAARIMVNCGVRQLRV